MAGKIGKKALSYGNGKSILLVLLVGLLGLAYQAIQPPPPKICGSPGGPPITAPRIRLKDGRNLAYEEHGVPRDQAKHKFIFIHGFDSCRIHNPIAKTLSPESFQRFEMYIVAFDRSGYGESDPDPNRTPKSLALDVEELADQLGLGSKFYIMGFSMGGEAVWGCLKYIPHRLAGATLLTPVINYWWSGLPYNETASAYRVQLKQDQWAVGVSHYLPWLTYWWNTQKLFPPSSVITHSTEILSRQDLEILSQRTENDMFGDRAVRQQGVYESIIRDMRIGFGKWEFSPLEVENPFPNGEGTVHVWQGDDDGLVPVGLQRCLAQKLPWIQYHEIQGSGHLFPFAEGMAKMIVEKQLNLESQ